MLDHTIGSIKALSKFPLWPYCRACWLRRFYDREVTQLVFSHFCAVTTWTSRWRIKFSSTKESNLEQTVNFNCQFWILPTLLYSLCMNFLTCWNNSTKILRKNLYWFVKKLLDSIDLFRQFGNTSLAPEQFEKFQYSNSSLVALVYTFDGPE